MGQGDSLTLIAANAIVAIEVYMLTDRAPTVKKSAFIDDRTIDAAKLNNIKEAISEIVEMDTLMGHTTNVDKSKILATTKRTKRQAGKMIVGGLKLNLVNDVKLLGHRCVAAHRFIIEDAEEAAIEAKIRVQLSVFLYSCNFCNFLINEIIWVIQ